MHTSHNISSTNPRNTWAAYLGALLLGCVTPFAAHALPQNPSVVAGNALFSFDVANPHLNITAADGTIINWAEFNIDQGELVRFLQANADSRVLNRVTSGIQSSILGDMIANGQVYLINTAGVLIGENSQIDTAGLVVSTLQVDNQDFTNGGPLTFQANPNAGAIRHEGEINVESGALVLIAPNVMQRGEINVNNGRAVLLGTESAVVMDMNMPNLGVDLGAVSGSIVNNGRINVTNGLALLAGLDLEQRGVVNANAAQLNPAGEVVLVGRNHLLIGEGSSTSASGLGANADGGTVRLTSDNHVVLGNNALVRADASTQGQGDAGLIQINAQSLDLFSQLHARGGANNGKNGTLEINVDNAQIIRNADRAGLPALGVGQSRLDLDSFNDFGTVEVNASQDITVSGVMSQQDLNQGEAGGQLVLNADNAVVTNAVIGGDVDQPLQHDITLSGAQAVEVNQDVTTNGNISLVSSAGSVITNNGAVLAASELNLVATTGIDVDSSSAVINLNGNGVGQNVVRQVGDVTLNGSVNGGELLVNNTDGDIRIGQLQSFGDVTLATQQGAIAMQNGNSQLTADRASLYATEGIDVDTDVARISAINNGTGDVRVNEQSGLIVEHIANNGGEVDVRAAGSIILNSIVNGSNTQANMTANGTHSFVSTGGQVLLNVTGLAAGEVPTFNVFDAQGVLVGQQVGNIDDAVAQVELNLPAGTYTVEVLTSGNGAPAGLGYVLTASGRVSEIVGGAVSLHSDANILDIANIENIGAVINIIGSEVDVTGNTQVTEVTLDAPSLGDGGVEVALIRDGKNCDPGVDLEEVAAEIVATDISAGVVGSSGSVIGGSSGGAANGSSGNGGNGNSNSNGSGDGHASGLPSCS